MIKVLLIRVLIFIYFIFVLFCSSAFALNINATFVKGLGQAYGFVLGQEYSLSLIAKKYPDLATKVELARGQFSLTFPDIKTKLEMQLKKAMGEKQFLKMDNVMLNEIRNKLGQQNLTREMSIEFLEKVNDRSKGKIETPVLHYILAVNYASNPIKEFLDGFTQRFRSDGSGKSQGIKLSLQIPKSWAVKEGERPHIVQKWQSENGTGLELIMLDIRDAQGYNPSKTEIESIVRSGEVKETIPEGATYIDSGVFLLEMRTGYWVHMQIIQERVGIKVYQEFLMYQLFFRGKAIGLMLSAGSPVKEKLNAIEAFNRTRPVFQQVLNSLVLEQAY